MPLELSFHNQEISFEVPGKEVITKTIERIIEDEKMHPGEIAVVFMSDDALLSLNKQFLQHDYYTDIITFDTNEGSIVNGELYISVDRVRENAKKFDEEFGREMKRVIFHGVLHLVGYNDKTEKQKNVMRAREEFYLNLRY